MRVMIGTPTFEKSVSVDYHSSMLASVVELGKHGIGWCSQIEAGLQFIDVARNRIVAAFLASDCTDLLFIDADQGWDAKVLPRILAYEEDVVCALPPKKCDPPSFHSNALTGIISPSGLFQSLEVGTGFMRIKRQAFEKLDAHYPELKGSDSANQETPYFQSGIKDGGFLGEDIFFCRKWTAMGEYLWVDADVTFTHRGSKAWKGNFYDHCVQSGLLHKAAA